MTQVLQRPLLPRRRPPRISADPPHPDEVDDGDPGEIRLGRPPRSARSKIIRLISVALSTLAVLVAISTAGLALLHHRVTLLSDEVAPETAANAAVRISMVDADGGLRSYLLTGQDQFLQPYQAALPVLRANLATLATLSTDNAALSPTVTRQQDAAEAWLTAYAQPIAAGTITRGDSADLDRASTAFDEFRASNDQISQELRAQTDHLGTQSRWLGKLAVGVIVLLGLGGTALVLKPGLRTLRVIGPPLEALHTTVASLRGGNLSARADPHHGAVEIRAVASAVNELADTNDRQRAVLAEQLKMSEAVRQLSLMIGNSLALEQVIDDSAQPIAEYFHTSTTWIRTWEGHGELPGRGRLSVHPAEHEIYPPDGFVSVARRTAYLGWQRQTYTLVGRHHPRDDDVVGATDQDVLLQFVARVGAGSLLLIPVGAGPECLGYVALCRTHGQPDWTFGELTALLQVGRDLGRAILHARIFEREQELVSELQDLDVKKRDFVSMVSHELRTPLSSIIGHLEIVRSGDLGEVPDDMAASLMAMERNSVRLTRLIGDLLLISRIEEGVQPTKLRPIDLATVGHDVVDLHVDAAGRCGVRLRVEADEAVPVLGDSDELERVVSNLVSNAIKFSPRGGEVVLSVHCEGDGAVIRVSDQGLGISPADQEQLFTRFFRSNNPDALAVPGTGLGLTITKLIVLKHRGDITVKSTMGKGSTFTVAVPLSFGGQPMPSAFNV